MARSRRGGRRSPDVRAGYRIVEDGTETAHAAEAVTGVSAPPVAPPRPSQFRQAATGARPSAQPVRAGTHTGWIPASALLPLRLFVGFTFLYAGLDKIALDPTFLDLSSRSSILVQLQGYAHASPIAALITDLAVPNALLTGVGIALAEIAVGLGVLSGLAFRLAAAGGAALSLLFFLTASWNVHPFYYGQDLPYLMGFLTLAVAGHGDLYVLGPWLERQLGPRAPAGRKAPQPPPVSPERRLLLHAGVLAVAAFVLAVISRPLKDLLMPGGTAGANGAGAATAPGAPAQAAASAAPVAGTGAGTGGTSSLGIATTAQVAQAGAFQFQVPVAVGNASPGDPGIVVSLGSSKYAAFDAVCTHAGCTVGWDPGAGMLICPCHGATFDPRNNGQAVAGPTNVPLTELPIAISSSGEISLRA